jgi:hypothetical protein
MLQPSLAVKAVAAVCERHDRDAIPLYHPSYVVADCHNIAGELMPEDLRILRAGQRVRLDGRHDWTRDVFV